MTKHDWAQLESPDDKTFRFRHLVAWFFYVWALKWNLDALWEIRQLNSIYLLPLVLWSFVALVTAGKCIERWLDGANRYPLFRLALVLSAVVSCFVAAWLTWHYAVFFFAGLVTFFQRPLELFSLTFFAERFALMCLGVVIFALYSWASLRVVLVLLSGERRANFEQVLGQEPFGAERDQLPEEDPPSVAPRRSDPVTPSPVVRAPPVPEKLSSPQEPPGKPTAEGWPAFEWVFRTQTSMPELAGALQALPSLAPTTGKTDAVKARDWISRLADHPGAYEVDVPRGEIVDPYVRTRTVRMADLAIEALIRWDDERKKARS